MPLSTAAPKLDSGKHTIQGLDSVLAGPKGQKPARRAESGPKGRQLEVGPVGPIDF